MFIAAAAIGFYIFRKIWQKRAVQASVAFSHGGSAVAGITLLLVVTAKTQHPYYTTALFLFCTAAFLGFVIFFNDMRGKPGPVTVIILHALAALAGLILLLYSFF
jgi:hypothetical protein